MGIKRRRLHRAAQPLRGAQSERRASGERAQSGRAFSVAVSRAVSGGRQPWPCPWPWSWSGAVSRVRGRQRGRQRWPSAVAESVSRGRVGGGWPWLGRGQAERHRGPWLRFGVPWLASFAGVAGVRVWPPSGSSRLSPLRPRVSSSAVSALRRAVRGSPLRAFGCLAAPLPPFVQPLRPRASSVGRPGTASALAIGPRQPLRLPPPQPRPATTDTATADGLGHG